MEKIAIVDCRAGNKTVYALEKLGLTVIPTVKINTLYDSVASHADIQIHYLGNNRFVCAPEAFLHYKKLLPHSFTLIKGSISLKSEYPFDIAYNAAAVDGTAVCRSAYTAPEILSSYKEAVDVKQGYAKCSMSIVGKNAVVTADLPIAKELGERGVDVLIINGGHIRLRGMNYGFIGGATGLLSKNLLAVNGDLRLHPDYEPINNFCGAHGTEIICLKDGIAEDIGTIIVNTDY